MNIKIAKISFALFLLLICILAVPASFIRAENGAGTNSGAPTGVGTSNPPLKQNSTETFTLQNPLSSKFDSVGGLLQGFIEIFSYLLILFAVLALIWTGLQYVLARGNPEEMKRLSNQLLYIVIGVAVIIGARLIIEIVINTLSASGAVNQGVINSARDVINR